MGYEPLYHALQIKYGKQTRDFGGVFIFSFV